MPQTVTFIYQQREKISAKIKWCGSGGDLEEKKGRFDFEFQQVKILSISSVSRIYQTDGLQAGW